MEAVFLKLLELSIIGSFFVLAVVLLRLIFRKAPKWVFCLLWGMVALRLVLPISIESGVSLIPKNVTDKQIATQMAQSYVGDVTYIYEGSEDYRTAVDAGRKPIRSAGKNYVVAQKDSFEEPETIKTAVLPALCRIWLAGVSIMLGYTLISYLVLRRKVSTATLLTKKIKQSECVDSPFVLGFFHPVIYLPYGIDDAYRENVIAHEMAHIQRKDHWWKPAGFLILSVYWFNPVMWLAYILLCRDIESACDEKVIKKMDRDGIRAYSMSLLNCSVHRRSIAACPLAFGEVGVKERIKRVMHYKKPAFWIVLLAVAASIVAAVFLLTSPREDEQFVMGAFYKAAELLYTNKQEQTEVFSRFCITADYKLLAKRQEYDAWTLNKQMEQYPLTAEELLACADYDNGWHRPYRITEIEDAYILPVENNYFYLVTKTKSGDTLLGFGGADPKGNPGDSSLRYLYRLESEFEQGEIDLDFLAQSLMAHAGTVNVIDVWDSEENPGFLVVGFLSGYNYNTALGYDDMGFAVFQTDGAGFRLLDCKVYEDAVYWENGICFCPDPVILSLDGQMKENATFDLILCCNENLEKIQREYYQGDTMVMNMASMQTENDSMHLFRWNLCPKADRVSQVFLDKAGNEITVKTGEEKILELVDRIVYNADAAASSNPYDYIKAKQDVYDELLSYGKTAVDCLVGCLRNTTDCGLKECIMAAACAQITGIGVDQNAQPWFDGKSWLALYDGGDGSFLGTPEDTIGSSLKIESLLGEGNLWMQIVDVRELPYDSAIHLYTYRFYVPETGKDYLTVENCIRTEMADFDGDGITELFVQYSDAQLPYGLYDVQNGQITCTKTFLLPDAMISYDLLLDNEEYYLYEERWAWFFKDPAMYVAEVVKRSEDRLYYICPSGVIPAYTDTETIDNAVTTLQEMLSGETTAYERSVIYNILTTIELSYTQKASPNDMDYQILLEKWDYPYEGSPEEKNCYEQMSDLFDADPVAFLKGMAIVDESGLKKELHKVAQWLVKENFLYDPNSIERTLNWLEQGADTDREKEIARMFRESFEDCKEPSFDIAAMLSGYANELWDALSYNPEQALYSLSKARAEERQHLGQKLWEPPPPSDKLLEKCYAAVNSLLKKDPAGALKDVCYEVLLYLESYGGYRDAYVEGQPFDYQRLFDKWSYSDGALATNCYSQMYEVFDADPEAFLIALVGWNKTAPEDRDMESIALSFAYQYQGDSGYSKTLQTLLDDPATSEGARVFIRQWEKITDE